IYTLMDFRTLRTQGTRFYKLYVDDGNNLNFYDKSPSRGKIKINQEKTLPVEITMRDTHGNASRISFKLQPSALSKEVKLHEPMKEAVDYVIKENVMVVSAQPCLADSNRATVYYRSSQETLEAEYANLSRAVYLIDLKNDIPDSI